MNLMAEMLQDQEERQLQNKIDQLKRQGYKYMKIVYLGKGPAETVKLQGARIIEAYETIDEQTQENVWSAREGAGAIFFSHDRASGRPATEMWDDEDGYNRMFVAKHLDSLLDVPDPELKKEISLLSNKKFSSAEARKRQLRKRMASMQEEIDTIDKKEDEEQGATRSTPRAPKRLTKENESGSPSAVGLT